MFIWVLLGTFCANAEEYTDQASLKGMSSAKAFFDVNVGEPARLILRLRLINRTFEDLNESGVKPQFIVGFRSGATRLVTGDEFYYEETELPSKKKIVSWIKNLKSNGIVMEQCAIAAELNEVDADDILPEIKVVRNGYISLIGYQSKGYAVVPMD